MRDIWIWILIQEAKKIEDRFYFKINEMMDFILQCSEWENQLFLLLL